MTKITVRLLKSKGACADQVALFAQHFPKGIEPTKEACQAVAGLFDWDWAARNLLSPNGLAAYQAATAPARAAYQAATTSAWAAYQAATAPAWAAYQAATASAFAEAWGNE